MVLLDTDSGLTWASQNSGAGQSTTRRATNEGFEIGYVGTSIQGSIVQDDIQFAGFDVKSQFGLASGGQQPDFSGLMGLGNGGSGAQGLPTIMQTLQESGAIAANVVGLRILRAGEIGQVTFGGTGTSGQLSWIEAVPGISWTVIVSDALTDGQRLNLGQRTAIVDSGQGDFVVTPIDAVRINAALGSVGTDGQYDVIPWSTGHELRVDIGGTTYNISPQDYVGAEVGAGYCRSRVLRSNNPGAQWSLGDSFLANVHAAFDLDSNQVGFASASPAAASAKTAPKQVLLAVLRLYSFTGSTGTPFLECPTKADFSGW